ncbi:hypothetical protein GCM10007108_13520 [Thermogymnomonas acidicola]|uniref:Uncharacterized protein n=1 Tax=Thermogymnomonas acidicola TaxID=399579 RepID=A0AA37BS24_9ARCH|nr:hypothetical protein GCM10007108_13520 [Thermogymnomonas acidicola]
MLARLSTCKINKRIRNLNDKLREHDKENKTYLGMTGLNERRSLRAVSSTKELYKYVFSRVRASEEKRLG